MKDQYTGFLQKANKTPFSIIGLVDNHSILTSKNIFRRGIRTNVNQNALNNNNQIIILLPYSNVVFHEMCFNESSVVKS